MRNRILAALLILAAAARAEGVTPYENRSGTFTISLPETWDVEVKKPSKKKKPKAVHKLKLNVPDGEKALYIYVWLLEKPVGPRALIYFERWQIQEEKKVDKSRIESEPTPHLVIDYKKGRTDHVYVVTYRKIRRNTLKVALVCPTSTWPQVKDAFFKAVVSIKTTLPRDPSLPLGYKEIEKDGFLYYLHDGAKKKDIKGVHKFLKDELKEFTKIYGKFRVSPENPPIIVLHANKEDASDLSEAAASAPAGFLFDYAKWRIFAVPMTKGVEAQAYCGSALRGLFFYLRFGSGAPSWLYDGDVRATWVQHMGGRKLPAVYDGYKPSLPENILAFDQLPPLQSEDRGGFTNQAFCYIVLFRTGSKKYRKPFQSFLKEYGETGDWIKAQQDHLFSLDQKKLQKEMAKFADDEMR